VRNSAQILLSASALLFSLAAHAGESEVKQSMPIGSAAPLSKAEIRKGVENGEFCTDAKGLANSRGAVINQDGKRYRCVKAYGESFAEHKALVWVEVLFKGGKAVTAD
jgi:hypothetical protein